MSIKNKVSDSKFSMMVSDIRRKYTSSTNKKSLDTCINETVDEYLEGTDITEDELGELKFQLAYAVR